MIRIACSFIAFFAWHTGIVLAGEIQSESLYSQALGRSMPYLVYLPDGYRTGQQRYPVLYLLHGAGGDEHAWAALGHIEEKADRLIAAGAIPKAIIIMPGCPACWWIDGAKDKAETAFWSDLVPLVDKRYRTISSRGGRLLAGLSAGGYGAIRYALRYPDRIAAVAALSPAIYTGAVPMFSAARAQPPFLGADGKFNKAAWDRQNYPAVLDEYFAQPNRVPFFLVSGNRDRLGISRETILLFRRLSQRQAGHVELRVVEGDHTWKVWEPTIDVAMRYVFRFADKPEPEVRTAGLAAAK
jgi:enterochelin esterase-like enzyme